MIAFGKKMLFKKKIKLGQKIYCKPLLQLGQKNIFFFNLSLSQVQWLIGERAVNTCIFWIFKYFFIKILKNGNALQKVLTTSPLILKKIQFFQLF